MFFCNPPRIYILYNHIDSVKGYTMSVFTALDTWPDIEILTPPKQITKKVDHKRRSDLPVIVCLYEYKYIYIYILTGQSQLVGVCLLCVINNFIRNGNKHFCFSFYTFVVVLTGHNNIIQQSAPSNGSDCIYTQRRAQWLPQLCVNSAYSSKRPAF